MKNFTRRRRILAGAMVLVCAIGLLLAAGYNRLPAAFWSRYIKERPPVSLTVAPVGTLNKPIRIARTGTVESATSIPINAVASGQIIELYIKEGQAVKAGQPLLKIMAAAQPAASETVVAPQKAQPDLASMQKEVDRLQKLYDIGAIPRRQWEAAVARLQTEKERVSQGDPGTRAVQPVVSGPTTLTAPTDGIVSGLNAAAGKPVQAGQQLLSLGSGQEVEVVVQLGQNDLYLVHLGSAVLIEAANQTIPGQVTRISPQITADQPPAFLARIKLNGNTAGLFKAGMTVNVGLDTGKTASVPAIPANAILHDDRQRHFVYVAVGGQAILQQISIGETQNELTELTSDLPPESMIIVGGTQGLKNGDPITVTP